MSDVNDWQVEEFGDGRYVVAWRGRRWCMEPKTDRAWIEGYRDRLAARYPEGPAEWQLADYESPNTRTRGGPWRYELPTGEQGVIYTRRKRDARAALRRQLQRKRLPSGTTITIA